MWKTNNIHVKHIIYTIIIKYYTSSYRNMGAWTKIQRRFAREYKEGWAVAPLLPNLILLPVVAEDIFHII